MDPNPVVELEPTVYPPSKILYLPAIKERVPIFEGTFRINQDVKVSTGSRMVRSFGKNGKIVTISGKLEYQACDKTICFPPTSVPVKWELKAFTADRSRAPMNIRHK